MMSRLQLDLERDSLARSNSRAKQQATAKGGSVDVFRGVSFDEWLKMIMQVCPQFSVISGMIVYPQHSISSTASF
jgi:hypothetical protein